jgi:hypothetical protein
MDPAGDGDVGVGVKAGTVGVAAGVQAIRRPAARTRVAMSRFMWHLV